MANITAISSPPTEGPTSAIIDKSTIFWTLLLASFFYVAKDYPVWRKTHSLNRTASPSTAAVSTSQPPQKASEPHKLWFIPFLPFIFLYLVAHGAWDLFRLGVFTLLQAIEWIGIALANLSLHVVTESLPYAIKELGVWSHEHALPALRFLGQKLREHGMPALVRACEVAFDWTVAFCMRIAAWAETVGTRLQRFWAEIGKAWAEKFLAGAKLWILDPLIWLVTRGTYLALVVYEAATRLAIAIWKDVVDLGQSIAEIAVKIWESALAPAGVYIAGKVVQVWTLATVQVPRIAWLALYGIFIPALKQTWGMLTGPTMQELALILYGHLISETTQRFLIGLSRRSAAAVMFWGQKSIRTTIFFVAWVQSVATKTLIAWHWTHTHVVLPLSYLLPETYRRFSSAIVRIYIRLTSALSVFATRFIAFLWPVLGPLVRLCDFIYTRFVRPVILLLYNVTAYIAAALITHVRPALIRLFVATTSLAAACYAFLVNRIWPVYMVVQAHVVAIAARVARIAGPVMAKVAEVAGQAYERVGPEMMKARAQVLKEADRIVEWIAANLMEWVKKETEDESVVKGEKVKAE